MKILVFGPRDRYDVYRPPFADEMPVELVFRRPDQTYVQAAQENADARIIFVDAITDVGPDVMDQLPELKMIHSEGVGYNCIDCQAARERGIYVCNNKGCNAESVAEHTIMLMLMALRFGIPGHNAVIQGQQIQMKQKAIAAHAPGLFQCAVGLVGFGDTAQATARRLASFGCKLYYYTRHRRPPQVEEDFGVTYLPLEGADRPVRHHLAPLRGHRRDPGDGGWGLPGPDEAQLHLGQLRPGRPGGQPGPAEGTHRRDHPGRGAGYYFPGAHPRRPPSGGPAAGGQRSGGLQLPPGGQLRGGFCQGASDHVDQRPAYFERRAAHQRGQRAVRGGRHYDPGSPSGGSGPGDADLAGRQPGSPLLSS